jgi:hypothetical protein
MNKIAVFTLLIFSCSACTIDNNNDPHYDQRNNIVGYYDVEEYSQSYNDVTYYSMQISKGRNYNEIILHDVYADGLRVSAIVNYDRITIPFQVVNGYEIDGTGTVYGSKINLDYRVKDRVNNARTDYCQATARFN